MSVMRARDALNQALAEEMERDERVILMGEDIGVFNGAFKVTAGLLERFGPDRVMDTPISENSIAGIAAGAAMSGLIPVVEIMTVNFSLLALDQIVNTASKLRYMFGGQAGCPLVVRMPQGGGHQLGPTHSHCFEALYAHVPGLLVACPATPADAKGMLKAAIRDPNPVIFIEHEYLYGRKGEVPDDPDETVPFGRARIARAGSDITIVATSRMADAAVQAAEDLAAGGISAEVIDPRSLRPLDIGTILASVAKTNLLLVADEGWPRGGVAADIAAQVQRLAFDDLDGPVEMISGADVPMPYAKPLEQAAIPGPGRIAQAARDLAARRT